MKQSDYTVSVKNGVGIVFSNGLEVAHGYTTRLGGVSQPPFDALNLGWNRDEPKENIRRNYELLCDAFGLAINSLVLVNYKHGTNVLAVDKRYCGSGILSKPLPECDGLVTNDESVVLATLHADCACLFVYDSAARCIGIAHAGWRGIFGRIGAKLVEKMAEQYDSKAHNVKVAISPCICENCYEVDRSLAFEFEKEFRRNDVSLPHTNPEKAYLNLRLAAELQFLDCGILRENIYHISCCTYENEELFYSYRRDDKKAGASAGFITLRRNT